METTFWTKSTLCIILTRSIKCVPVPSGALVVKSKLSLHNWNDVQMTSYFDVLSTFALRLYCDVRSTLVFKDIYGCLNDVTLRCLNIVNVGCLDFFYGWLNLVHYCWTYQTSYNYFALKKCVKSTYGQVRFSVKMHVIDMHFHWKCHSCTGAFHTFCLVQII